MMDRQTFRRINKLHTLWGLAMHDLDRAMRDPNIIIDMRRWVHPISDAPGRCMACMAGLVAIYQLDWDRTEYMHQATDLRDRAVSMRLGAINSLRMGRVSGALVWLNQEYGAKGARIDEGDTCQWLRRRSVFTREHWIYFQALHRELMAADL